MASVSATGGSSNPPAISFFGNTPLSTNRAIAASNFLAGDETISIIPSFTYPETIGLISGQVGPFRAGMDTEVPLWMATMLRRRKLAKIIPPSWMDVSVLKEVLRFERDPKEASFSPDIPFRHAEISHAILSACRAGSGTGGSGAMGDGGESEVPNADQVKLLLEDIQRVRMDKIRRNVHTLSSQTLKTKSKYESIIDVTNIGSLEMHQIKPFITDAFRNHRELSGKGSSYSTPLEEGEGGGAVGVGGRRASAAASSGARRGRLRTSRLARNNNESESNEMDDDEELEIPRPLDEDVVSEAQQQKQQEQQQEEELDEPVELDEDIDGNAGQSRLRRHR
jgi:GINS complex subunit 2